jgi:tRNA(fMet)-specific endonuclease VapC
MTRFLMDTGIASDYLNRRHGVYDRARTEVSRGNPMGIGVPVLAELVSGIERSQSRDRNMQRLRTALPSLRLWPFDRPAAFEYGRIQANLLTRGRKMQVVDMMVAAIALVLGQCTVVTKDTDLSAVPGLPVENWAT